MRIVATAISFCLWSALAAQCLAVNYTLTGLGSIIPGTDSDGYGLNSSGQVVGVSGDMGPPCLFAGGTIQPLGGGEGTAVGINDSGQIVGQSLDSGPFLYSGGTMQVLAFAGTTITSGFARGINNNGDVVGRAAGENAGGTFSEGGAFLYSGGVMHNLDPNGVAYAINDRGQIAGRFTNGFLYSNGVSQNPGTFPGVTSYTGLAINDKGDIAGTANFPDGQHAFVYIGGVMHDLGLGAAEGINNHGQVVGYTVFGGSFIDPFLYSGGSLYYLDDLVTSRFFFVRFLDASAINDAGQITGTELFNGAGNGQAFLLTPTPEPSSLVLAALGFAGLAAWGLRRNRLAWSSSAVS